MKARTQSLLKAALFTFIVIVVASTAAFAGGKESVDLPYETKVGATLLAPGTYTLQWDDSGKAEFLKGKKVVASGQATIVKRSQGVRATSVSIEKSAEGGRQLREIEVAGKNVSLTFVAESGELAKGN